MKQMAFKWTLMVKNCSFLHTDHHQANLIRFFSILGMGGGLTQAGDHTPTDTE